MKSRFCRYYLLFGLCSVLAPAAEQQVSSVRLIKIENWSDGKILGSDDGGNRFQELGNVLLPIEGGVWLPSPENKVLAFDFLRGPSQVFATAVNAIHLKFSDPKGYELPKDPEIPVVIGKGVSVLPVEALDEGEEFKDASGKRRAVVTDIPGGTLLFGSYWSPKVASEFTRLSPKGLESPVSYDDVISVGDVLVIRTVANFRPIEYLEFENKPQGMVFRKYVDGGAEAVAKVLKPVQGIGRFGGSYLAPKPGVIRANHAGVLDIATTDVRVDPDLKLPVPVPERPNVSGGFQIVPSHHWFDESMKQNRMGVSQVYMVVGPLVDPPDLKRYDRGIDGTAPLFHSTFRAGGGRTEVKFVGETKWSELSEAVKAGKFLSQGVPLFHLRGFHKDVLKDVDGIRYFPEEI